MASICAFGRRIITSFAILLGRDKFIPSADYKLYSCSKWNVNDLFDPIPKLGLNFTKSDSKYIVFAVDDTKLHKTGNKLYYFYLSTTCRAF